MIKQILLVGAGGAVGSIFRFLISELTNKYYAQPFPLATFGINILGCFVIGLLIGAIPTSPNLRLLLIIGFCGGFTTFSTFARETFDLLNTNQTILALSYAIVSCVIGIIAVWLGMLLTK